MEYWKVVLLSALFMNEATNSYYFFDSIVDVYSHVPPLTEHFPAMLPALVENSILQQKGAPARRSNEFKQFLDM